MDDEERANPLSSMGLTDEQYNMILQNIINGQSFMNGMVDNGGPSSSGSSSSSQRSQMGGMNGSMGMTGMSMDVGMGMGGGMNVGVSVVGEKRGYEEAGLSGSSGREKRSRFEVVD